MKNVVRLVLCLGVLLISQIIVSQTFKTPNTPAFSILDYEPTSVMRPSSYKELSADILNSFDENGNLMMNLGLEVTPYWLKSNPELTRESYINPTVWQSIKQTFTLSAATVKDSVSNSNNLGFGFRTQLVQGKVSKSYLEKYEELNQFETIIGVVESVRIVILPTGTLNSYDDVLESVKQLGKETSVNELVIDEVLEKGNELKNSRTGDVDLEKFCFDLSSTIDESVKGLTEEVIELQKQRVGFSLELASAAKFMTVSDSGKSFNKLGFWVNANHYVSETDALTLTARLMSNMKDTLRINADVGLGYLKQAKSYNISLEAMLRWYKADIPSFNGLGQNVTTEEKDLTYRIAAQMSYFVNENISINVSLGKDFESPELSGTSFFSIFGLQYSLFENMKLIK